MAFKPVAGRIIFHKGKVFEAFPFHATISGEISLEMKASELILWCASIALESLVLARGWMTGWFKEYVFFFAYVACVLIQDIVFLIIYLFRFRYYSTVYWCGEFFSLVIGCGVAWEIFHLVLARFPGVGRMVRNVLLFCLIMVFIKALYDRWNGGVLWPSTAIELERNLRAIQALSLTVLAGLSVYYRIPITRNVKGIFSGYGLFVATSVVTLTLRASFGKTFHTSWVFLQPFCYTAVLGIWCATLWKYEPADAVSEPLPKIEEDYQSLAQLTKDGLIQARVFLGKAMRP